MILLNILIVFSLTLILTKSKVLAGKRDFVELRYEASKVGDQQPGWIHSWWHALWTCSMCSGFWIAIPICLFYPVYGPFVDILVVFGANWLVHCLENLLFFSGKLAENLSDINLEEQLDVKKKFYEQIGKNNSLRLIEKNLKKILDSS